ncbi:hypothetical protein QVD17_20941 [Tagetes erecta]|uniref:RING-type domain-containing protein n=1 Tax=Tagetes erecta TaxID=13708 RepID=A0AAD8KMF9_TARER|nr:hypothetical protein QVD17_20941 [Tagetes erecta]
MYEYIPIYKRTIINNNTSPPHFTLATSLLKMFPRTSMSTYIIHMFTYLAWAWDFMTHLSFFQQRVQFQVVGNGQHELGVTRFQRNTSSMEPLECAVCLLKIEDEEEIGVLRCDHLFHKACLDRCVEYGHTTCPLCRDFLSGPRMVCELGRELLVFSFGLNNSSSDDDYDQWWIRESKVKKRALLPSSVDAIIIIMSPPIVVVSASPSIICIEAWKRDTEKSEK